MYILSTSAFNSLLFSERAMVTLFLFGFSCLDLVVFSNFHQLKSYYPLQVVSPPSYAWGFSDSKIKLFHTCQHPHSSPGFVLARRFRLGTVYLLCGIQLAPRSSSGIRVYNFQEYKQLHAVNKKSGNLVLFHSVGQVC